MNTTDFWSEHDRQIQSISKQGSDRLESNLYRGMPTWFNSFFSYFQYRAIQKLMNSVSIQTGSSVIDIGCGTGRLAAKSQDLGLNYIGIDPGRNATRVAYREYPTFNFINSRLPAIPFQNDNFDLAFSIYVLQHVQSDDQASSILEISRVLRPGGYLLVCESIDIHDATSYLFPNSYSHWNELLSDAGFIQVKQQGLEFIPIVKCFHLLRDKLPFVGSSSTVDVISVGSTLKKHPILSIVLKFLLTFAYPLEFVLSVLLPARWARSVCFLLRKT